ncbi:MAG: hypothetical protein KGI06_03810 [Candidatus Micrarchaeota archaeon]|nr:hypothetical protein [Candidatus Micrarchaeota archaeon]
MSIKTIILRVSDLMTFTKFPKAGYIITYLGKDGETLAEKPKKVAKYFYVGVEEEPVIAERDKNLKKDLGELRNSGCIIKFVKKLFYPGYIVE